MSGSYLRVAGKVQLVWIHAVHCNRCKLHTKIGLLQCTRESVLESKSGVNLHAELMDQSVDRKHGMVFMVFEYGEIDLHKLLQKQAGKPIKDNFIRLYWQQV